MLLPNDVAVNHILHALYPEMSEEARKRRRLRCYKSCCKGFLPKADDVVTELLAAEHFEDVGRMANAWQKQGGYRILSDISA
jgi:hypothetical protein